jgi:hypothetical protein
LQGHILDFIRFEDGFNQFNGLFRCDHARASI